jgi:hypothetical protein
MNLVGKIFTVLISLMCVVFGTFALMVHAAHKNWRDVVVAKGGLNDQLTEANKEKQNLAEEKKNLETALNDEKERTKKRLIALEQEAKKVVAEKSELESKIQVEEGKSRVLALAIKETSQRIGVMQTEIEGMRNNIKVAVDERNDLQKNLVSKTDDLMNAVAERQKLEKLQRELALQVMKMKETLAHFKIDENFKATTPPAGLEGEVTSVPRPDTVEISIGADDGVRKGHRFDVTRPSTGRYIGKIEVIQVDYPNRAVCRPDNKSLSDQIQKGDHVKADTKPR